MTSRLLMLALAIAFVFSGCKEPNAPAPAAAIPVVDSVSQRSPDPRAVGGSSSPLDGIDLASSSDQTYCNIESVGGVAFAAGALPVQSGQAILGWLGHSSSGNIESPTILFLDEAGNPVAAVALNLELPREDVASAYGARDDLGRSGFEIAAPVLANAKYRLLLHYQFAGKAYRCDNGRQISM